MPSMAARKITGRHGEPEAAVQMRLPTPFVGVLALMLGWLRMGGPVAALALSPIATDALQFRVSCSKGTYARARRGYCWGAANSGAPGQF